MNNLEWSKIEREEMREAQAGPSYWLLKMVERAISEVICKEASEWDEVYDRALKECQNKHPDWDHKDARYDDVEVARAYSTKSALWELAEEVSAVFQRMGVRV